MKMRDKLKRYLRCLLLEQHFPGKLLVTYEDKELSKNAIDIIKAMII